MKTFILLLLLTTALLPPITAAANETIHGARPEVLEAIGSFLVTVRDPSTSVWIKLDEQSFDEKRLYQGNFVSNRDIEVHFGRNSFSARDVGVPEVTTSFTAVGYPVAPLELIDFDYAQKVAGLRRSLFQIPDIRLGELTVTREDKENGPQDYYGVHVYHPKDKARIDERFPDEPSKHEKNGTALMVHQTFRDSKDAHLQYDVSFPFDLQTLKLLGVPRIDEWSYEQASKFPQNVSASYLVGPKGERQKIHDGKLKADEAFFRSNLVAGVQHWNAHHAVPLKDGHFSLQSGTGSYHRGK